MIIHPAAPKAIGKKQTHPLNRKIMPQTIKENKAVHQAKSFLVKITKADAIAII